MKIELKIPDGWVRVQKGRVIAGDRVADWPLKWYRVDEGYEIGKSVRNFHCVIRRKGGA